MFVYIWLGIIVIAMILEFITADLVSIWFVGGGVIALILALCGVSWYIQLPCFIVASILSMLLLRKYIVEKFNNDKQFTNAESVIGKEFKLLTPISFNKCGTIKVNDVIWNVCTENEKEEVEKNTIVIIKEIKGNKYIVEVVK